MVPVVEVSVNADHEDVDTRVGWDGNLKVSMLEDLGRSRAVCRVLGDQVVGSVESKS